VEAGKGNNQLRVKKPVREKPNRTVAREKKCEPERGFDVGLGKRRGRGGNNEKGGKEKSSWTEKN